MANATQPSHAVAFLRPEIPLLLTAPHPRAIPKNPTTWAGHLRKRRASLGITQTEAALHLQVRKQTLSSWETGEAVPNKAMHPALIAFLGHDPSAGG